MLPSFVCVCVFCAHVAHLGPSLTHYSLLYVPLAAAMATAACVFAGKRLKAVEKERERECLCVCVCAGERLPRESGSEWRRWGRKGEGSPLLAYIQCNHAMEPK